MKGCVYLLLVSAVLALGAPPVSGQGAGAAAQGRTAAAALDPELTNYQYPYPVGFYEFDAQGQRLQYVRALLDFIAGG